MTRTAIISSCLLLAACTMRPGPASPRVTLHAPSGQTISIPVEIAATSEQQERGLMFRTHLAPDTGMLFVFPFPKNLSFWMKNTLIPLDVLFFDASGTLVSTASMTPCTTDPCPPYASKDLASYALEVPAGFIQKYGIHGAWRLSISGSSSMSLGK